MKLLFDQNLSPKLVQWLGGLFPLSIHVQSVGLDSSDDDVIWEHALQHDYAIVTKDVDYNNLSIMRGSPPKVVWLLTGKLHKSTSRNETTPASPGINCFQ